MHKNKKTATMTWIRNNNYGSVLQAYALQTYLINNGYENIIIDYNPSKITRVINLIKNHNSLKLFYEKFKSYLSKKRSKKVGHDISGKHIKFQEFIDTYLIKTKEIRDTKGLRNLSGEYDVYICGSDQIWNPDLLNLPYYFDFLESNDKKISYSPSFGVKRINNEGKRKIINKYLKQFSHISVREEQGLEILKTMDLKCDRIPVVLDPTLLLSKEDWKELEEKEIRENKNEEYVLCYFLGESSNYWESARNIAEKMNLKVYVIPNCEESYNQKNMKVIDDVGPKDWINLIKKAKFVLTDSFHGIVFSLIFHRDFYAYKRFDDNLRDSQNSRVENILKKVNLENRLYSRNDIIEKERVENIPTFSEVDKILKEDKEKSVEYLISSIEE